MQFDKSIFALFNREDFTYRKGDEVIEKEYSERFNNWTLWCNELAKQVDKFEVSVVQNWQNSGQLARNFWTRLKFTPFINSESCVSMCIDKDCIAIELGFEFKKESSNLSKDDYSKLIIENPENWANECSVNKNLFYICAKTNKCSLNEYFSNSEKINWFANTKSINIKVGVFYVVEQILELDTEAEKLIDILQKLSYLYE